MQRTTLTTLVLALGLALSTGTTHGAEIGHYTPGLLNSYLINSPMLPDLKRDADGGVTIYIQQDSPGKDNQSNWLPAPNGPFWLAMRIYWPKSEALDGVWKQPPLMRAE